MKTILIAFVCMLAAASCATADPATAPAKPLAPDSGVEEVLAALDRVGKDLKDFTAGVKHTTDDAMADQPVTNEGRVWYESLANGDARVRVDLPVKIIGNRKFSERKEYLLEGGWLVDRDFVRKVQVKRPIGKPGQKLNLFKLGQGPFPLPIGQDPKEVQRLFDVKKIAPGKDDPKDTARVQLVPKEGNELKKKFKTVDVWVDTKGGFPVKIQTEDVPGKITTTTQFDLSGEGSGVNRGLSDKDFILEPVGKDWNLREE